MPRYADHDERRRHIVEAAWRVIAKYGIDQVTIRELASEAGTSTGVLAHYFESKDDILLHALKFSHERIDARFRELLAPADGLRTLRELILDNLPLDDQRRFETRIEISFWDRALANKRLAHLQRQEASRLVSMMTDAVKQAEERGAIVVADRRIAVEMLLALIDGLSLHAMLYPGRVTNDTQIAVLETLISSFTHGVDTDSISPPRRQDEQEEGIGSQPS